MDQVARPSPQEILIATADARCQKISGLLRTIRTSLDRDAGHWVVQNQSLVLRAAVIVEEALGNARIILRQA
ncbi:MAG TPA: hypothetical protein VHH34_00060 [Pseudonocardiaceae bacterium]|nr:hypothetical protein [Pseudonocardiaceae bacterium]